MDLGIVEYRVNAADFEPGAARKSAPDQRSIVASKRMKRTHEAAAYDAWFREQVQAAINDPRPSLGADQAHARMAARRQALLKKKASAKPAGKGAH